MGAKHFTINQINVDKHSNPRSEYHEHVQPQASKIQCLITAWPKQFCQVSATEQVHTPFSVAAQGAGNS